MKKELKLTAFADVASESKKESGLVHTMLKHQERIVQSEKDRLSISQIFSLLQLDEKQDEAFSTIVDIFGILKSKSNEEADARLTAVTEKIAAFDDDKTVQSLNEIAQKVYNSFQSSE